MRAVLVAVLVLSGCLGAPAPPAPVVPPEFPAETTLPLFTVEGALTADAPLDEAGGAAVVKREAYWFDEGNRTVYWLSEVVKPTPQTSSLVHLYGTTTYADGNSTRFDDVRRFEASNFVAYYLITDFVEEVRFQPVAVCGECDPLVVVNGTTLAPGQGVDLPVRRVDDGVTYAGTLRFENAGAWKFKRVDGCRDFDLCPAFHAPRTPPAA